MRSRRTSIAPDAIVFDFDLTLADSRPAFVECHHFAARALGLPLPGPEAIARTIGIPLERVLPLLYDIELVMPVSPEYLRLYQEHADEVMTGLTVMLPGAAEAVQTLYDNGFKLAIVSQKLRYRVEDVLAREGLRNYFRAVLGGEDLPDYKPDPRGLLLALTMLETPLDGAIFVGDTLVDAETARRANVPFIAVLSGVTGAEELQPYAPLVILDSVSSLPGYLGVA
jgi:phosphoglycolate phosphatase